MNKKLIILSVLLVSTLCFSQNNEIDSIQEAYLKNNKKVVEKATPMIDYFLKYQDSSKTVTQGDFNKLMTVYGAKETKYGMTKEEGFEIVDWYIKASEGPKKKKEKEEIDEAEGEEFSQQTEEEKLKEKAQDELPDQIKSIIGGMSYKDFKELMLMANPNATDAQIKKEYQKMQNQAKKL